MIVEKPLQEPERNPELNKHGVNRNVAPNPEFEKQQAQKRYREEIVVTDPRTGKGYTQYQLDHTVSADEYKRLVFGENFIPTISTVIKPNVK
jgi:hypothetical protein